MSFLNFKCKLFVVLINWDFVVWNRIQFVLFSNHPVINVFKFLVSFFVKGLQLIIYNKDICVISKRYIRAELQAIVKIVHINDKK